MLAWLLCKWQWYGAVALRVDRTRLDVSGRGLSDDGSSTKC